LSTGTSCLALAKSIIDTEPFAVAFAGRASDSAVNDHCDLWVLTGTTLSHVVNFEKKECFTIDDEAFHGTTSSLIDHTKSFFYDVITD